MSWTRTGWGVLGVLPVSAMIVIGVIGRVPAQGPEVPEFGPKTHHEVTKYGPYVRAANKAARTSTLDDDRIAARRWIQAVNSGALDAIPKALFTGDSFYGVRGQILETRNDLIHRLETTGEPGDLALAAGLTRIGSRFDCIALSASIRLLIDIHSRAEGTSSQASIRNALLDMTDPHLVEQCAKLDLEIAEEEAGIRLSSVVKGEVMAPTSVSLAAPRGTMAPEMSLTLSFVVRAKKLAEGARARLGKSEPVATIRERGSDRLVARL